MKNNTPVVTAAAPARPQSALAVYLRVLSELMSLSVQPGRVPLLLPHDLSSSSKRELTLRPTPTATPVSNTVDPAATQVHLRSSNQPGLGPGEGGVVPIAPARGIAAAGAPT